MAPRDQQRNQQNNQPNQQVVGAQRTNVDSAGCNTVTCGNIYYVKLNLWMYERDTQTGRELAVKKLPYIYVYQSPDNQDTWTVIKANNSTGGIVVPVSELGEYRIYVREPHSTYTVGDNFTIPYHALDNGTQSQRAVQAICGFTVAEVNNQTTLTVAFPIDYPSREGRITNGNTLFYPNVVGTHILNNTHTVRRTALVIGNTNGRYMLTSQLWADISKAYGTDNTYIQNSTNWRTVLEQIYSGDFEDEPTTGYPTNYLVTPSGIINTRVNDNGETVMLSGRILVFDDDGTERRIVFQDNCTEKARKTNSFDSANRMLSTEALRRTHPCVFEYWLQVMHDLDITTANVTSAWRPNLGSMLHRYSVGLDIGKLTANIEEPIGLSATQTRTISVSINIDGGRSATSTINELGTSRDRAQSNRQIALGRSVFVRLTEDKANSILDWQGAPWQLTFQQLGVTRPREIADPAIATNDTHKDHIHISLLPNVPNVGN